jgi:hypothetical protein
MTLLPTSIPLTEQLFLRLFTRDIHLILPDGAIGIPTVAKKEAGETLLQMRGASKKADPAYSLEQLRLDLTDGPTRWLALSTLPSAPLVTSAIGAPLYGVLNSEQAARLAGALLTAEKPPACVLNPWRIALGDHARYIWLGTYEPRGPRVGERGWSAFGEKGEETGEEGMALADEATLRSGRLLAEQIG